MRLYSAERNRLIGLLIGKYLLREDLHRIFQVTIANIKRRDRDLTDRKEEARRKEEHVLRRREGKEFFQRYIDSEGDLTERISDPALLFAEALNEERWVGSYSNDMEVAALPAENYGVVIYERIRQKGGWLTIYQNQIAFLFKQVEDIRISYDYDNQIPTSYYELCIDFNKPILVEGFMRNPVSGAEIPLKPTTYHHVLQFSSVHKAVQAYRALQRCMEETKSAFTDWEKGREALGRISEQVRKTQERSMKPDDQIRW